MNQRKADTEKAEELENTFITLAKSCEKSIKFCVVCLRTEDERVMVKNVSFKAFITAVKLENSWQNPLICFMCERQATNALKFFRAAMFASSINKIFAEMNRLDTKTRTSMFQRPNFIKLLNKINIRNEKPLPSQWQAELDTIQKQTELRSTKTLVVDTTGVRIGKSPETRNCPESESVTVSTATVKPAPAHVGKQPGLEPGGQEASNRATVMLRSNSLDIAGTFVVIDDEEDPLQIEKDTARAPQATDSPVRDPTKQPNLKTPKLVPIEQLLEKPVPPPIIQSDPNYVIYPVILSGQLPSIPHVMAGNLSSDGTMDSRPIIKKILVYNNTKDTVLIPNDMFLQSNVHNITITETPIDSTKTCVASKRNSRLQLATPAKKSKVLPDQNDRIDWEDKIPMDVISFVDAVDPNPTILPVSSMSADLGLFCHQQAAAPRPETVDVIDLC